MIHVRHDALAYALNETPVQVADEPMRRLLADPDELRAALQDGRERFISAFALEVDGRAIDAQLTASPTAEAIDALNTPERPARLPIMLEFVIEARLPAAATRVAFTFPQVLGDLVMTIERPAMEPYSLPLRAGERSPDFDLTLTGAESASRSAGAFDDDAAQTKISATADLPAARQNPKSKIPSAWEVAWRYVILGITHIIPHGLDHMLFVLGLFFLSNRLKPLLWQVTAFTLAHSVTLTLATLNIVTLPPEIVEPVIAASIAFVALENLLTSKIHPWRPAIVFCFGLIHGMGFAGVLKDLGLPRGQLVSALVSFNVGVEIGQLSVIALALIVLLPWRKKKWYRRRIAIPASALIAAIGLWWTAQRVFAW